MNEFGFLLEILATITFPFIILGDFNIHVDTPSDQNSRHFIKLLETFGLNQHIDGPTHSNGHTLDLVITKPDENLLNNFDMVDPSISDPLAILCRLSLKKEIIYRKLRSVDIDKFIQDITNTNLMNNTDSYDVTTLVDEYNNTLSTILNRHAPCKKRVLTIRAAAPWYSHEIKLAKRKRRKLERQWRKTKLTVHKEMHIKQFKVVQEVVRNAKANFYSNLIEENKNNPKVLFTSFNELMNLKTPMIFPSHENALQL